MPKGGRIQQTNYGSFGIVDGMSSWYDLEMQTVIDNSNERLHYAKINADQATGDKPPTNGAEIVYRMPAQQDLHNLLPEAFFIFQKNITSSGVAYADGAVNITFAGTPLTDINEVQLLVNNEKVERIEYANLHSLIKYVFERNNTKQDKAFFRPSSGSAPHTFSANTTSLAAEEYNKSIDMKLKHGDGNKNALKYYAYPIYLKDLFPFVEQHPVIIPGSEVQIRIKLLRNDNVSLFKQTGVTDGQTNINKLVLWAPRVKPSDSMNEKILKMLASNKKMDVAWEGVDIVNTTDFSTANRVNWRVHNDATRVQRIVFMVRDDGQLANQDENAYLTSSRAKPQSAYILYNGERLPQLDLERDENGDYVRMYKEYLRCARKGPTSLDSVPLSYEQFVNGYTLLCFDLSQMNEDVMSFTNHAHIDFVAKFDDGAGAAPNPAVNLNITAFVYYDKWATINYGDGSMRITDVRPFK